MNELRVTRTTVDSVNWTPLVAPAPCDYVAFLAESGTAVVTLRQDKNDPSTEKTLGAGVQETIATTPSRFKRDSRFIAGDVVFYIKTLSGTDVIVATWMGVLS